jgi:hypothetical protein
VKWSYGSIPSAVIFAVICMSAFSCIDGMSGGYAIVFVSFRPCLHVLLSQRIFPRAKIMGSILNSTQLLAHRVHSSVEAEQSARREYIDYQERNHAMISSLVECLLLVRSS